MTLQFDFDFSGKLPPSAQLGRQTSYENADDRWIYIWGACIVAVARRKEFFTSDDVLGEFESIHGPSTHNLSAIGGAMHAARKRGVMSATNEVRRSERPEKHGNRQNVWRSNYFRG